MKVDNLRIPQASLCLAHTILPVEIMGKGVGWMGKKPRAQAACLLGHDRLGRHRSVMPAAMADESVY